MEEVAAVLGLSPGYVQSVATFYGMFHFRPVGRHVISVCDSISCALLGSETLVHYLEKKLGVAVGETTPDRRFTLREVECLGACDRAPSCSSTPPSTTISRRRRSTRFWSSTGERRPFLSTLLLVDTGRRRQTLVDYEAEGLRHAAARAGNHVARGCHAEEVKKSGLRGRGGASFPTGMKWGFLPKDYPGPRYLVCNADEGEPRNLQGPPILEWLPHRLIEGRHVSSAATPSAPWLAYIYIRGEYYDAMNAVNEALAEAYRRGYLGRSVMGKQFACDIYTHPGAGAYICGEETALLDSLEGKRGHPRVKPPFPAIAGLYARPTVINNVETLASLPLILEKGGDWFAAMGPNKSKGFRLFSVSGHVKHPGNFEVPLGTTFRQLIYDLAGGMRSDKPLKAFIPGGASAPIFTPEHLDLPLDFEAVAEAGSMLGSGAVIVMEEGTCMVWVAKKLSRFFRDESCGQCLPCREGTAWLNKILTRIEDGRGSLEELEILLDASSNMTARCICVLPDAAAGPVQSTLKYFRHEYEEHLRLGRCPFRNGDGRSPVADSAGKVAHSQEDGKHL
ncbi:NADH-quinone oxidoreductase subunit NuoF [bacterium]|nr:NADH-quinone oxidoreductase subunit NuoF [bacterium]